MKKVILLMAALMAVTFSAQAQKKSKAEKAAEKAKKEMMTAALIDRVIPAKNFQFVPYEYIQTNTGTTQINRYEYTKLRPNSMEVYMTNCPGVQTNRYEWLSCEKKKDNWVVKIKVVADNGNNLSFDFAVNSKTGIATLRVRSNKSLDQNNPGGANSITYKGNIREY
ncbi:hypothetical protein [Rikenella microfusus]|uniref:DUF4251 domain-containing protein n=1 Tax=Rikenella microfusus TaxID=28139 RepID=A0A379MNI1_9BACT|nr:hypothetical protein [Rikenella microfusus]SUE33105.1 Uncharacterised protein [Rikenella microfusus]HJE89347.1 hypothetical protein [Rikenella microfusus]